jgi:hypothetical protein
MKKLFRLIGVAVFGLTVLAPRFWGDDEALGQDQKPAEKMSAAEIEALAKQLGDNNFAVRERATKRLEQTPGALAQLRPLLKHDVLEVRRRVEGLVERLSARNFKSLLREIVERKQDVPLDLLIDVVVGNRERMDDGDWKRVLNAVECVKANLLKDAKTKTPSPDPSDGLWKFPLVRGESLSSLDGVSRKKVVGGRIGAKSRFTYSVVITSGSFECGDPLKSVVLANGGISMDTSISSLVFSNEEIKCHNLNSSVVMARGSVNATRITDNNIVESLVFSEGDITCDHLISSTAVARGRVKAKRITDSVIFEHDSKSAKASFFSLKSVGLILVPDGKAFRVEKVMEGSRAQSRFPGWRSPSHQCSFRLGRIGHGCPANRGERSGTSHPCAPKRRVNGCHFAVVGLTNW